MIQNDLPQILFVQDHRHRKPCTSYA